MKVDPAKQRFFYRVAGIVLHRSRVLLHRDQREDYWVLPGGSCEFGEDSKQALAREFMEELQVDVQAGKLLCVVENFFQLGDKSCHELGFYYRIELEGASRKLFERDAFFGREPFPRLDGELPTDSVQFRWVPLSELPALDVKPSILKSLLLDLPEETRSIVHRDGQ